jgi:WD40 repeat protein
MLGASLSQAQAKTVIEYLAEDGFFDRAMPGKELKGRDDLGYVLSVMMIPLPPGSTPKLQQLSENLGTGDRMLRALYALRRVLDGDAARAMDELLRRVDDRLPPGAGGWRERGRLVGHEGAVHALSCSPDGKVLASCDARGTVKLWDLATFKEVASLDGNALCLAFAPDGKWLATGGVDHTVRLWEVPTRREVVSLRGPALAIGAVAFSPEGRSLAVGGTAAARPGAPPTHAVQIWDVATRQLRRILAGHDRGVMALAFSPDGKLLAVACGDSVKVWDTASGKLIATLGAPHVTGVAWSPDGRQVLAATGPVVQVWNLERLSEDSQLLKLVVNARALAVSADGRVAVAGHQGEGKAERHFVHVLDRAGAEPALLEAGTGSLMAVALSPDGRQLLAAGDGRTVHIWEHPKRPAE